MCTLTFFFENIDNYDSESYNVKKKESIPYKGKDEEYKKYSTRSRSITYNCI